MRGLCKIRKTDTGGFIIDDVGHTVLKKLFTEDKLEKFENDEIKYKWWGGTMRYNIGSKSWTCNGEIAKYVLKHGGNPKKDEDWDCHRAISSNVEEFRKTKQQQAINNNNNSSNK